MYLPIYNLSSQRVFNCIPPSAPGQAWARDMARMPRRIKAQKGVPIGDRSTIGRQRLPDGKMKSTPPRCARPVYMELKKGPHLPAEATGAPCWFAALPNFEIFLQAVVKGFLAMNEQTQSLSAKALKCVRRRPDLPKRVRN